MKKWKKSLAALLAAAMLLGLLAACDSGEKPSGSAAPSDGPSAAVTTAPDSGTYPLEPQELGSGEVKWSEEKTADGWMKVTNQGGETLGYSPDSGVSLIQVDGFAFKDLNKNGKLDLYEDWRQEDNARAADLAKLMTPNEIAGLMVYDGGLSNNISSKLDESQTAALDDGVRGVQNGAVTYTVKDQAEWSNAVQGYAEGVGHGIPVMFTGDPRNSGWGIGVSHYPDNLALAATFDPELTREAMEQLSKEYRAIGFGTLLGSQIDLASDPRWGRNTGAFGEDPALSRDMANAAISGLQSTYDENGGDLGWGADSLNAMMKHFPGDGAAQAGREAHDATGSFNIYPGGAFEAHLIPFIDGGLNLDSKTGMASAAMTSYSIAWSEDEEYGELVATAFSEYKVQRLRSYGFDGVICTDWGVTGDNGKCWGVEDLSSAERVEKAIMAGVDQFGGDSVNTVRPGIELMIENMGEEAATERLQESARRLLKSYFQIGLFENPYLDVKESVATVFSHNEEGYDMQEKTVVMLKNDGAISQNTSDEKPTVYIPLVYTPATMGFVGQNFYSADLPVSMDILEQYFNVVTDTVSETLTGPAGEDGNPTLAYADVIRATPEQLAQCDYALVFARTPKNTTGWSITGGFDMMTQSYVPLSLQYGEYVANSSSVRKESIAGRMVEAVAQTPYGEQTVMEKENQSYYGKAALIDNATDLDMILYAAENMPEGAKVIVAMNTEGKSPVAQMVMSEFEDKVDAILYGFNIDNRAFLDIATGKVEPSALLPVGMPASMEAVEKQLEDVPRDMECHVDTAGNTYEFGFGLNWSGVIQDERTAKYCVAPLTEPATQPVK
ncbi:MAG: glycoside hydrolase family 3 protein [Oscillospiraceae bacterium]|nr:glycoside hydrolase family 3 protein [Oscillospiraceae bacterium]